MLNKYSVTKPGIVITLFLFTCSGIVCGLGGYLLGHRSGQAAEPAEIRVVEKKIKVPVSDSKHCPPCKKGRPIILPKMNCPHTRCPDELQACQSRLEGIKRWCDPNCQEYLETCEHDLQELKYTSYPLRHPYFP